MFKKKSKDHQISVAWSSRWDGLPPRHNVRFETFISIANNLRENCVVSFMDTLCIYIEIFCYSFVSINIFEQLESRLEQYWKPAIEAPPVCVEPILQSSFGPLSSNRTRSYFVARIPWRYGKIDIPWYVFCLFPPWCFAKPFWANGTRCFVVPERYSAIERGDGEQRYSPNDLYLPKPKRFFSNSVSTKHNRLDGKNISLLFFCF